MSVMLYIIVHNVSSVQRLTDIARFILTYTKKQEVPLLVLSRVSGSAAQTGLAEVSKLAYKLGRPILITEGLDDALQIIQPEKSFIVLSQGEQVNNILKELNENNKVALILPGSEAAFSKYEAALATPIKVDELSEENGIVPLIAITIHKIITYIRESRKI
ncbi:MAG: hypothetical protein B6U76_05440 [Desulfurococcales archaeon ex4484_217_2]|nr:MAG: hypothetical protein B6U76_05440 [Desulfurococcales archaeon ex4484_217_2]